MHGNFFKTENYSNVGEPKTGYEYMKPTNQNILRLKREVKSADNLCASKTVCFCRAGAFVASPAAWSFVTRCFFICSARDWDGKDYLRLIPRVVW